MSQSLPNLREAFWARSGGLVCGVDEAGRGPWAGPLMAGAVALSPDPALRPRGLRDSKKLSEARREALAEEIRAKALFWAVAEASAAEVDALNPLQASMLAMRRAVEALGAAMGRDQPLACILIDGNRLPQGLPAPAEAIVGGDDLEEAIAAASILAKTTRDQVMRDLARLHPEYGWERNKGYGAPIHRAALTKYGPTAHHRRSYKPVAQMIPV
ncbi:ribonuclease HII [Neomegalonema sp.]|uniref:ribonuclease HII n=1 Tax=Neomegalonema sp. TaxID=2039713 RepID=UPI0026383D81|nr:ribonuclease HII [Neomegalonema sp.]MDD2869366.1 ribonuclease HII [Neomegalonema sp.]